MEQHVGNIVAQTRLLINTMCRNGLFTGNELLKAVEGERSGHHREKGGASSSVPKQDFGRHHGFTFLY
jgi:hypothetical protein